MTKQVRDILKRAGIERIEQTEEGTFLVFDKETLRVWNDENGRTHVELE